VTTLASAGRAVAATPLARPTSDRPFLGIGLILLSMLVFSIMDGISKGLAAELHPIQVAWGRFFFVTLSLVPLLAWRRPPLRTTQPVRHVVRGVAMLGSSVCFVFALAHLPLAEASAIGFASPLMITALSIPLLGENVGIRRWSALIVGFIGVLIVIRPGGATFDYAAIYPLLSAACWAFGIIITRQMQATEDVLTTLTWSTVVGFAILSAAVPFTWSPVGAIEWVCFVLLGVLSTVGQLFLINAFRYAGASLLSPFSYSQMLWATIIGWLAFAQLPDVPTWIGTSIIMASGVYTLHRERVRARERLSRE
jgi:drug/metabolite transporter (DMT)-like permease